MKLHLFVTAAIAAAAFSAPAFAAEPVGSIGVTAGHSELDLGPISAEGDGFTVDGNVAFKATPNWTVTLSGAAVTTDDNLGDDTTFAGSAAATFNGAGWRAGPFVSAGEANDETLWAVGGVVQRDVSETVTLAGAAGYGKVDGFNADLWGAKGEVRYFVRDNFRLDAGLGWTQIDGGGADADLVTAGVGGEYQFAGTPWSITGGYEHTNSDDLDLTADTFKVGFRYGFGGDLKTRDRSGADLGGVTNLFSGLE